MTFDRRQLLTDLCVGVSVANILYLRVWGELIFAAPADRYWLPSFTSSSYLAAVVNVWLIGIVLGLGVVVVRASKRVWLKNAAFIAFLVLIIPPAGYLLSSMRKALEIKITYVELVGNHPVVSILVGVVLAAAGLYVLIRRLRLLAKVAMVLILVLSPFALVTTVQAIWRAVSVNGGELQASVIAPAKPESEIARPVDVKRRDAPVVWIIFDELDLRLAFTERPEGVHLPEFERLRQETIFVTEGASYHEATKIAIPAFLTGRDITYGEPAGPSELLLKFAATAEDAAPVSFSAQPTIFSEVYEAGLKTAIVGIYHPYCRLFASFVMACRDFTMASALGTATPDLWREMVTQYRGLTPLPLTEHVLQVWRYQQVLNWTKRYIALGGYDLLFVHAPVPHAPYIYDRANDRLTAFDFSRLGYFANLELADKFFGEIRAEMVQAGTWDESAVIVTSDHEWRFVQHYDGVRTRKIPFLLKLPHQKHGVVYDRPLSPTRATKALITTILAGELKSSASAVEWLERRAEK